MPSRKAARHYYDRRMAIVRDRQKKERGLSNEGQKLEEPTCFAPILPPPAPADALGRPRDA
jgi:hypothetical protein